MDNDLPSDLLALWQLRRRQLDDLLAPLLVDGSIAATRLAENLGGVIAAVDNERIAFEAFLAAHELADDSADDSASGDGAGLPPATDLDDDDELSEARQRIVEAADLDRRQGHPSQSFPSSGEPAGTDPSATIHQLTPRGNGRRKR